MSSVGSGLLNYLEHKKNPVLISRFMKINWIPKSFLSHLKSVLLVCVKISSAQWELFKEMVNWVWWVFYDVCCFPETAGCSDIVRSRYVCCFVYSYINSMKGLFVSPRATASHYQDIIGQDTLKNDTTHVVAGWISWQLPGSLLTAVLCRSNSAFIFSTAICSFKDY